MVAFEAGDDRVTEHEDESDGIGLGCALELFSEVDEVNAMIDNLKNIYNTPKLEGEYDRLYNILKRYYEQPHLLDAHLDSILAKFIVTIRDTENDADLKHAMFNYMYQIVRIRGYKTVVRHLPHEVSDFQLVLGMLEQQDPNDKENWRSRFVLLLWLSIIVIIPFHMTRLDGFSSGDKDESGEKKKTVMERILEICKLYATATDACALAGAFLTSKFVTRSDVKEVHLEGYIAWACEQNTNLSEENNVKYGVLAALAAVLKHGKREDLLPYAAQILRNIQQQNFTKYHSTLVKKYCLKIIQRIGMLYLPARVSLWRYHQGCRSLAQNLTETPARAAGGDVNTPEPPKVQAEEDVPEQVEEVIELLLCGLKERDTTVRWSAAKGVGRVAARLPPGAATEVSEAVLSLLADENQLEHSTHGGCMALAELSRRGLAAENQLGSLVDVCIRVLRSCGCHFKGTGCVRDAGAHVVWALARAYPPHMLKPYANQLALALICTACFDREINCRRAASAAFQESVGRHGLFPHGIDVLTAADFQSVGPRTDAFLVVAPKVASFSEYTNPMIDHLAELKLSHWDGAIRELTALALNKLAYKGPRYMAENVLPTLTNWIESDDLYVRHGAVLAAGQIILALADIQIDGRSALSIVDELVMENIKNVVKRLWARRAFQGLGGELMRSATCKTLGLFAAAEIEVGTQSILDDWLSLLEDSLSHQVSEIRENAVNSLPLLFEKYLLDDAHRDLRDAKVDNYCNQLKSLGSNGLYVRMGHARALGLLPEKVLIENLSKVVESLIACAQVNDATLTWAESRRDAVIGLTKCIETVGVQKLSEKSIEVEKCLLNALEEYTSDKRGDIGAWVREAAMQGSFAWCSRRLTGATRVCPLLARAACEKIDRTRALAAKIFTQFIYHDPPISDVPHHEELKAIIPKNDDLTLEKTAEHAENKTNNTLRQTTLWFFPEHTMATFVKLLDLDMYRKDVVMGLIVSGGDLTESLIKHTTQALFSYLTSHTNADMLKKFCDTLVQVFSENQNNNRITVPIFPFLDRMLGSGTLSPILEDSESTFAADILKQLQIQLRTCKSTYKLLDSINVLCQLIQVGGTVCKKALSQLCILLCNQMKYVRKSTATRTYEALLLYGDTDSEKMAQALNILSETDWERDVAEIRPIRNELCTFLGITPPVLKSKNTSAVV